MCAASNPTEVFGGFQLNASLNGASNAVSKEEFWPGDCSSHALPLVGRSGNDLGVLPSFILARSQHGAKIERNVRTCKHLRTSSFLAGPCQLCQIVFANRTVLIVRPDAM